MSLRQYRFGKVIFNANVTLMFMMFTLIEEENIQCIKTIHKLLGGRNKQ